MAFPPTNPSPPRLLSLAVSDGVPKRSFIVALVVGTILNLINQGDLLWAGADIDLVKIGLNYLVPYLVATCGAIAARWRAYTVAKPEDAAARAGRPENPT